MRSGTRPNLFLAVATLLAATANAEAGEKPPQAPDRAHTAEDCPAVFGDDATHARNSERRKSLLILVWPGRVIDLVHRADWRTPRPLWFDDLRLIAARRAGTRAVAFVVIENGSAHCEAGEYPLHVDDSVGGAAVLAILDDVVLVEYEGKLRYLAVRGATDPAWRMTWQAPWRMPRPRRPAHDPPPAKRPKMPPTPRSHR